MLALELIKPKYMVNPHCVDVEEDLEHIIFKCLSYNGYCSNIFGFFIKKNVAPSMQLVFGGFKSVPENVEIAPHLSTVLQ